jgi:hypothetical protein
LGPAELQVCDFSQFVRGEWGMNSTYDQVREWQRIHPLIDINPITEEPFKNVVEMREAKIRNMLQVTSKVKNYYIINYEDARDYPEEVVEEVAKIFRLKQKSEFKPIVKIRGIARADDYVPIKYPPISELDYLHINNYLDEELENSIGYQLRPEEN